MARSSGFGPSSSHNSVTDVAKRRRIKHALLGLAGAWWGYEAFTSQQIDVNSFDVVLPKLPAKLDGFRVVQLSDLHRRGAASDQQIMTALKMAEELKPDILVLTGDFVASKPENLLPAAKLLATAHAKHGVYAVLGNHDNWIGGPRVAKALRDDSVIVLVNRGTRPVEGLFVAGTDDWWTGNPDAPRAFNKKRSDEAGILLAHSPKSSETVPDRPVLVISGHTHGGQICVPFIPRNCLPGLLGSRYVAGWYRNGHNMMYVNRGIGTTGPAVRFYCRPEITVYVLRHEAGATEVRVR